MCIYIYLSIYIIPMAAASLSICLPIYLSIYLHLSIYIYDAGYAEPGKGWSTVMTAAEFADVPMLEVGESLSIYLSACLAIYLSPSIYLYL